MILICVFSVRNGRYQSTVPNAARRYSCLIRFHVTSRYATKRNRILVRQIAYNWNGNCIWISTFNVSLTISNFSMRIAGNKFHSSRTLKCNCFLFCIAAAAIDLAINALKLLLMRLHCNSGPWLYSLEPQITAPFVPLSVNQPTNISVARGTNLGPSHALPSFGTLSGTSAFTSLLQICSNSNKCLLQSERLPLLV